MTKLDNLTRKKIIESIKKGVSIPKISKYLGLSKGTIYPYYKKIKGKRYVEPRFKVKFSEMEGEIVGIFVGDGSQYHRKSNWSYRTKIHFGIKNQDYVKYVKNIFEEYFNKKFRVVKQTDWEVRLQMESKKIFNYFKNYLEYDPKVKHSTVRLKTLNLPRRFKIGFLRGLFDTDGSIWYIKQEKGIKITFHTTSKMLSKQVERLIKELGLKYGYYIINRNRNRFKSEKTLYTIQLWKESVDTFLNEIKPFKGRRFRAGNSMVECCPR